MCRAIGTALQALHAHSQKSWLCLAGLLVWHKNKQVGIQPDHPYLIRGKFERTPRVIYAPNTSHFANQSNQPYCPRHYEVTAVLDVIRMWKM